MDTIEAIRQRVSTRVFLDEGLDKSTSDGVSKAISSALPFYGNSSQKIFLVDSAETSRKMFKGMIGGFGKLVSSSACLVSVCRDSRYDWINSGFMQEQVIIELTKMGLSSCWVGGQVLFDVEKTKNLYCTSEGDVVTNLVAIGHAKQHSLNSTVRTLVGARKRKPIGQIAFLGTWGSDSSIFLTENSAIKLAVEMAILSPSSSNRQPARVVLEDRRADFYTADTAGGYAKMSLLDAGIFMSHFYLAMKHQGICVNMSFENAYPDCEKGFAYAGTITW